MNLEAIGARLKAAVIDLFQTIAGSLEARYLMVRAALAAIWSLLNAAAGLFGGPKPFKERIAEFLGRTSVQKDLFAIARLLKPNFSLPKQITSVPNTGSVVVTRAADVIEVLDREADFGVVYGDKMIKLTGGDNFYLGMQNGAAYQRDVSFMRLTMRREDAETLIAPLVRRKAQELLAAHPSGVDLPVDLTLQVPTHMVAEYFGVPGPSPQAMIDWASILFDWLFFELDFSQAVEDRALIAAKELRDAVADAIAQRKANGVQKTDLIGRALELQKASPDEFSDHYIRNLLVGLIIGAIPTISKASCQALSQLLDRPEALAGAQAAAKAGDEARVGAHLFEALRYDPINAVIYRKANRDTVIARSSLRAKKIKKDEMVFASNLSAMFDPLKVKKPENFDPDRPWGDYILWGYGMHTCSGAQINRLAIPAMLTPLLARSGLRRAAGAAGQIDLQGTKFPVHFRLEND